MRSAVTEPRADPVAGAEVFGGRRAARSICCRSTRLSGVSLNNVVSPRYPVLGSGRPAIDD